MSPGMTGSAAPLLAMSLEPTATVLAAVPPTVVLMTGLFYLINYINPN